MSKSIKGIVFFLIMATMVTISAGRATAATIVTHYLSGGWDTGTLTATFSYDNSKAPLFGTYDIFFGQDDLTINISLRNNSGTELFTWNPVNGSFSVMLENKALANFDYYIGDGSYVNPFFLLSYNNGRFSGQDQGFRYIADNGNTNIVGTWEFVDAPAVPIPAAILLLGSGLAGLAGLRTKRKGK